MQWKDLEMRSNDLEVRWKDLASPMEKMPW